MSGSESEAEENLTGVWDGVFRQRTVGSVAFTATLIQSGNQISGSTHESCVLPACPRKTHLATLLGHRDGHAVAFVKTYDPRGFGYDTVKYSGTVNADATEIVGTWTIDSFFGDFLMTRASRSAEVRSRKTLAAV